MEGFLFCVRGGMLSTRSSDHKMPKTPWESALFSFFVPGAGQFNNKDTLKGILLIPCAVVFYFFTFCVFISHADVDRRRPIFLADVLPLYEVLGVVWIYSIIDAYVGAARLIRMQQGFNVGAASNFPPPPAGERGVENVSATLPAPRTIPSARAEKSQRFWVSFSIGVLWSILAVSFFFLMGLVHKIFLSFGVSGASLPFLTRCLTDTVPRNLLGCFSIGMAVFSLMKDR